MNVDWNKWAAIAEIMSSVTILLTLVYLALQTQQLTLQNEQIAIQTEQNTAAIQATVRQAMLSEDRESLYKLIEYPFLDNECGLTAEEVGQSRAYSIAFIRMRENHWLQYQNGVLDRATWESYMAALPGVVLDSEVGRSAWELIRGAADPGFVAVVEELMAETPIVRCE